MNENNLLRVAAYVRVSTTMEEQEGSYEIQRDYFTEKINANPNMMLVGIYGDYGKSALKTKGRDGLAQLMEDCEAGKIDLILTKSISRFARNMADCAEMIRRLRELNVGIRFEKEGIDSKNPKCDLVLNIFAALAQEESNSISQNMTRAYEQHVKEGRPYCKPPYGYTQDKEHVWHINEQEAERVRLMFDLASKGNCITEILWELDRLERRDETGYSWQRSRIKSILTNLTYKGDFYSHGHVCLVPGKSVKNDGYRNRYYLEGHHEPIVSEKLFDWVQEVVSRDLLNSARRLTEEEIQFLTGREAYLNGETA